MLKSFFKGKRIAPFIITLFLVTLSTATIWAAENSMTGVLNATRVNIRQGPGLNHQVVGNIITEGAIVEVLERVGDWVKIYYNGLTGYIYTQYVDIEEEEPAPETETPVTLAEETPPPVEEPPPPPAEKPPPPPETSQAEVPAPTDPEAGIVRYQIQPNLTGYKESLTGYHRTLERAINLVFLFLVSLEKRSDLDLEERKQIALDFIRIIRWGPDNRYYFWINDLDGKMIMEPLYPDMEGKICLTYKDLNAKEIFIDFIKTGQKFEQGFVDHQGLGYDGNTSDPRISIIRLFMEWEWIVGTALHLDYVEAYEEPEAVIFNFSFPAIEGEIPLDDEGSASPL